MMLLLSLEKDVVDLKNDIVDLECVDDVDFENVVYTTRSCCVWLNDLEDDGADLEDVVADLEDCC